MVRPLRRGDIYDDPRWRRLRKVVRERDRVCQLRLQGCTGGAECADHIVSFVERPDLAFELSNVQAACRHCNSVKAAWSARYRRRIRSGEYRRW
jgi:5-methylcytosine-specific restriction endonuclease McrA